ncbi:hypothetical protein GCM10020258_18400 [Sphingomonas yabuuchiae]
MQTVALAPKFAREAGAEYVLTVRAHAKDGTIRAVPANYVVGWEQFALTDAPAMPVAARGQVAVADNADSVTLSANGAELVIDRKTGLVTRYAAGGRILAKGGQPNFVRAETDNDTANGTVAQQSPWFTMNGRYQVRSVSIGPDRSVAVDHEMGAGAARFVTRYKMAGDGAVDVDGQFVPLKADLPPPVRIGLWYTMPTTMKTVEWYGRGPHESYVDRKSSAAIGLWRGASPSRITITCGRRIPATRSMSAGWSFRARGGYACSCIQAADDAGARLPLWRPLPPRAGDVEVDRYRAAWRDDADRRRRAMGCRRRHDLEPCRPAASAISHRPRADARRLPPGALQRRWHHPDKAKPARATEVQ